MSDYEIYLAAVADGWSVRKVSLYDEEDVEGWEWKSSGGAEVCEIGAHDEWPAIPDFMRSTYDPTGPEQLAQKFAQEGKRDFAAFLDDLLFKEPDTTLYIVQNASLEYLTPDGARSLDVQFACTFPTRSEAWAKADCETDKVLPLNKKE